MLKIPKAIDLEREKFAAAQKPILDVTSDKNYNAIDFKV